jgi:hypothetical protein
MFRENLDVQEIFQACWQWRIATDASPSFTVILIISFVAHCKCRSRKSTSINAVVDDDDRHGIIFGIDAFLLWSQVTPRPNEVNVSKTIRHGSEQEAEDDQTRNTVVQQGEHIIRHFILILY